MNKPEHIQEAILRYDYELLSRAGFKSDRVKKEKKRIKEFKERNQSKFQNLVDNGLDWWNK